MATPTPPIGPSIGTSRLLNGNNLQQAVDSFTATITKVTKSLGGLASFQGSPNGAGNPSGISWNSGANRYGINGGGARFTLGSMNGGAVNGGGGSFAGISRTSATVGAIAGVASALTNYANKNMAGNFQSDYFGAYSAFTGGGNPQQANRAARAALYNNNNVGLNYTDVTRAGFINAYTFGSAQYNGSANPAFVSGMRQANSFGYASPTLGATGAALAAQQTYSARSLYTLQALGYASPFNANGTPNSMRNIASSVIARAGLNQQAIRNLKPWNIDAAFRQGGGLQVNLQYLGQAAGWSQSTIQEYSNVIRGQLTAESKGMSESKYYQLLGQAQKNNRSAINQLAQTTGLGTSMFEHQRSLNATRMTRQNDILDSLAPAFDHATDTVNKFSQALTNFLKATGLDKAIGTGAGTLAPFSNALGGFSGAFGAGAGLLSAGRLFGMGRGLLGGLGGAGATAGEAGILARAGGLLKSPLGKAGALGLGGYALDKVGHKAVNKYIKNKTGNKWANGAVTVASDAAYGAAIGTLFGPEGTVAGAAIGGLWGLGTSIFGGGGEGGVTGTTGNSARNSSVKGATTASAAQIIKYAETQLGVDYVWGGEQPGKGFDCSGLTQWAYSKAGVTIPRVASDQQKIGTKVPVNKTQPGDLLFVGDPAHHVVMSIGGGKIIEAPHPGAKIGIRALNPSEFTSATRIIGSIGNMNSLLNENTDNSSGTLNNQQYGGDIGNLGGNSEAANIASALAGSAAGIPMVAQAQNTSSTTGAGTGSNPKATGSNAKGHLQAYAKSLLDKYGWGNQWSDFNALEMSEAGWNVHATNPSSGAYGLAQALPASKYSSAGKDWKTSGETQLRWMMDYIKSRYGSPSAAWSFHQKNNWYAAGAWNIDKDQPATVHKGEMIIPAQQAETIRQTLINNTFNPNLQRAAGINGGDGRTISFGDINIQMPSTYAGSAQDAQVAGKMIVNAIEENLRIKNLQIGQ